MKAVAFSAQQVQLQPGDLVVLVTDGVTEALGTRRGALHQIAAAVRRPGPDPTPAGATESVLAAAKRGSGPEDVPDWQDDRTVFAFRLSGFQ